MEACLKKEILDVYNEELWSLCNNYCLCTVEGDEMCSDAQTTQKFCQLDNNSTVSEKVSFVCVCKLTRLYFMKK